MTWARKTTLVTGAAGFIGFHVCKALLEEAGAVIGIDNLNPYYDVSLKRDRLEQIASNPRFTFYHSDINDIEMLRGVFSEHRIHRICNLAAQAGVRYSLQNPFAYEESNLRGFLNLLEMARQFPVENFVFASSSSVYGKNEKLPFSTQDNVDTPISLYAATKKANELMAHAYSHLFDIPLTGLRYFTVYGPWGRPDMAIFLFTQAILGGRPIDIYNFGRMKRDFTYIDDAVDGTIAALKTPFKYEIFNLGNSNTIDLMDLIGIIEEGLEVKAKKNFLPLQPGDIAETYADIERATELLGFRPRTPIREGVRKFLVWYRRYYNID